MSDKIQCQICRLSFRRITRTHLLKHNMTTEQYQTKFPGFPIICESMSKSYSKRLQESNPMHDPAALAKFSAGRKGVKKTEEHSRKIGEAQTGEKHHSWGKKRPEHSKFMTDRIAQQKADGTYVPPRQVPWTDERRKLASQRRKGISPKRNPNQKSRKGIPLNLTPEQRAQRSYNSVLAIKHNLTPKKDTTIERLFKQWCDENNIAYEHQFVVCHNNVSWLFDFYIPHLNMLVEVDGEFWHSKPKQLNRDKMKTRAAYDCGFRFLRLTDQNLQFDLLWETDSTLESHNQSIIQSRIEKLKS